MIGVMNVAQTLKTKQSNQTQTNKKKTPNHTVSILDMSYFLE